MMRYTSQMASDRGRGRDWIRTAPRGPGGKRRNPLVRGMQVAMPLLLVLSLLTALPALADDDGIRIAANEESSTSLTSNGITDGEYVVYTGQSVSVHSFCAGVNGVQFGEGERFSVTTISDSAPMAVDNGYLITSKEPSRCWDNAAPDPELTPGVALFDLESGEQTTLVDAESWPRDVAIDYPYVAWTMVDGSTEPSQITIWVMNVETDSAPTAMITQDYTSRLYLFIDGETIYWVTTSGPDGVGNSARATIGEAPTYFRSIHDTTQVALAGDVMATITEDRPLYYDMATGQSMWLSELEVSDVDTDGRFIYWITTNDTESYLTAFDTTTNARFKVWAAPEQDTDLPARIRSVDAHDGAVAWDYCCYNTWMSAVHGVMLVDRLPSAAQPDPGTTSPDWTYYSETGHYLAHDFRAFWDDNGGLPVFGYPMTEEFDYLSPETGEAYAAQMTERQRFEWHPENIGTPYAVLLGRLGETILQQQGRDWTAFEQADPSAEHYFEATGHAIAPEFYDYWASHGLDLGHAGVSFDESLALFGYPLSEPMMETNADGDTVLTQYFERAVFEHHPDNPESSQVLLRRLGAELVESWGW